MNSKVKANNRPVDAEFGIDSRYKNKTQREQDAVALMQARLNRMKDLSEAQILQARLMQLKLRMENYLNEPVYEIGRAHV